ncbi:CotY/CotZ family spore coat protein [Neobacillus sp. DY30]|uniref:CotY/CotZ family spore coat protein n=1 Tax=Neobacillus sp. DY30 TaxID=3047871 RepID=UPI0024C0D80A|nr:CotY/CotZ family spore coat protein [Neobacillus sp. DY30]WHY02169.1 CotY/CotZ family spore coat protein [Neobacillus sp. DY30]
MGEEQKNVCICQELQQLLEEQKKLSFDDFRFVCEDFGYDTIPFILSTGNCQFEAFGWANNGDFFTTNVFRVEAVDVRRCCATISLLEPVDIDGYPVDLCEVFSLRTTSNCLVVDLSCFKSLQPLSPSLVDRLLPIVEPK